MEFTITQIGSFWSSAIDRNTALPRHGAPWSFSLRLSRGPAIPAGPFTHDEIQHILLRNGQCPSPCRPFCIFFFFLSLFISPSHSAYLVTKPLRLVLSTSRRFTSVWCFGYVWLVQLPPPPPSLSPRAIERISCESFVRVSENREKRATHVLTVLANVYVDDRHISVFFEADNAPMLCAVAVSL